MQAWNPTCEQFQDMTLATTDFINQSKSDRQVALHLALAEMNTAGSSAAASSAIQPSTSTNIQENVFAKENIQFSPQSCARGIISDGSFVLCSTRFACLKIL